MAMGTAAMEEAHDRIGCCTGNNEVVAGLIGNMEEVAAACSETMLSGCGFLLPGRLGRSYSGHGAERRPDSDHGERRPESDHEGGVGYDVAALLEPMPSAADFRLPTDHEVWLIQNLLGEELDVVLWEWAVFGARPTGSDLKRGHCWCV